MVFNIIYLTLWVNIVLTGANSIQQVEGGITIMMSMLLNQHLETL